MAVETNVSQTPPAGYIPRTKTPYEEWIASTGVPIHRGYFIEDVRTVEVGWWEERQCNSAFLVLAGQEGVSEARVTEIGRARPSSRPASRSTRSSTSREAAG